MQLRINIWAEYCTLRYKTQYKKHSFTAFSISEWNALPESLHKVKTLFAFKRNCKKFLYNGQYNTD